MPVHNLPSDSCTPATESIQVRQQLLTFAARSLDAGIAPALFSTIFFINRIDDDDGGVDVIVREWFVLFPRERELGRV
jgi:hypothetical protein